MATMDYIVFKGATFLGAITKRDEKGKPKERSKDDHFVNGVGNCRVGHKYDITEWVERYEGELFQTTGCKQEVVTKNMDNRPEDNPTKKQTKGAAKLKEQGVTKKK